MKKWIILDRDGTLVQDFPYENDFRKLVLLPTVVEGLRLLNSKYKLLVFTNQSGVGRGRTTMEKVNEFNQHLRNLLSKEEIRIEDFLICPHHPDDGCGCRKPAAKLALHFFEKLETTPDELWVIGDKAIDMHLAKNLNAKGLMVLTGDGEAQKEEAKKFSPISFAKTFLEAARFIEKCALN